MPHQKPSPWATLVNKYFVALQIAQFGDPYLMTKVLSVMHMVAPSSTLFMPDVAAGVLWHVISDNIKSHAHSNHKREEHSVSRH